MGFAIHSNQEKILPKLKPNLFFLSTGVMILAKRKTHPEFNSDKFLWDSKTPVLFSLHLLVNVKTFT